MLMLSYPAKKKVLKFKNKLNQGNRVRDPNLIFDWELQFFPGHDAVVDCYDNISNQMEPLESL